mmetsp:Transcript_13327/g.14765  ORF Transcript_13327/g.14765 Transcript_13327/m.14765 type:complete len:209 (-) Transcript_13327:39-665(-)
MSTIHATELVTTADRSKASDDALDIPSDIEMRTDAGDDIDSDVTLQRRVYGFILILVVRVIWTCIIPAMLVGFLLTGVTEVFDSSDSSGEDEVFGMMIGLLVLMFLFSGLKIVVCVFGIIQRSYFDILSALIQSLYVLQFIVIAPLVFMLVLFVIFHVQRALFVMMYIVFTLHLISAVAEYVFILVLQNHSRKGCFCCGGKCCCCGKK